jgi:hypothetical protein
MRLILSAAALALATAANAQCANSAKKVLATGAQHATWSAYNGRKCWFAGYPHEIWPPVYARADTVPLPRPRPLLEQLLEEFKFFDAYRLPPE